MEPWNPSDTSTYRGGGGRGEDRTQYRNHLDLEEARERRLHKHIFRAVVPSPLPVRHEHLLLDVAPVSSLDTVLEDPADIEECQGCGEARADPEKA